eukprot:14518575-Alexandrium_andersonii.AAC.1
MVWKVRAEGFLVPGATALRAPKLLQKRGKELVGVEGNEGEMSLRVEERVSAVMPANALPSNP